MSVLRQHNTILTRLRNISVMIITPLVMMFSMIMPAYGADKAQAEQFTQQLITELSRVAKTDGLSDNARDTAYRNVLQSRMATESIGKFLFKGAPDKLANAAQRQDYKTLFPSYIAATFAKQIGALAERDIVIKSSRLRGDNEALVSSTLVNSSGIKKASIDWRLRWIDGQPYLLDVLVERVSPLVSKRQAFSSLAERQGVEALLEHMRQAAN